MMMVARKRASDHGQDFIIGFGAVQANPLEARI